MSFGDYVEIDLLKEVEKRFKILDEMYYLENSYPEECPRCNQEMTVYSSKYNDEIVVRVCWNCCEIEDNVRIDQHHENTCDLCGELVKFEDEDQTNHIICSVEGCGQKAHKNCVEDIICDTCRIWACEDHESEYTICDKCGLLHDDRCIKDLRISSFDPEITICNNCYYRDEDLIDEIKRPLKELPHVLTKIDEYRYFYIKEAKENPDHSIMLTHLIRGEDPYKLLKIILREKKLRSSETGYYGKSKGTKSVCFTDLTTRGLNRHSKQFSAYGIAFLKDFIFEKNGGPALYIRENLLKKTSEQHDLIKPYVNKINIKTFDYHHEREWRVPHDLDFEYHQISIVYAPIKHHNELRNEFPEIINIIDLDFLQLI